jgi:hypothetical protein
MAFSMSKKNGFIINIGSRRPQQGRLPVRILPPRQNFKKLGSSKKVGGKEIKYPVERWLRAAVLETPVNLDYAPFDGGDFARFGNIVRSSGSRELGYFKRL